MESERESEYRFEALYLIGSENELSRILQVHSLLENLKQKSRNQGMVKKQIDSSCQVSRLPRAFYSSLIVKYYHRIFYNPDLKPFLFYHPLRRMWGNFRPGNSRGPLVQLSRCLSSLLLPSLSPNHGPRIVVVVQSLRHVRLFSTPLTAAHQAPLSYHCHLEFAQIHVH